MPTPGKSISSFWDPTDDEGGGGSERDRFPSASCVVPRGRFSSFLGMPRLGSWRRNMPGLPPRRHHSREKGAGHDLHAAGNEVTTVAGRIRGSEVTPRGGWNHPQDGISL